MKKTMLALACAAVCVAGAEDINSVGFENYTGSKLMSNGYDDFGNQNSSQAYFTYDTSNGSEDGSTVVSHEGTPVAVKGTPTSEGFGDAYLSLSTEGGTLWRTIKGAEQKTEAEVDSDTGKVTPAKWDAIEPQEVSADTGLYIDTMVQFTPTEDGSEPEIGKDAKLAIWLNVATADDGTATTNLCVRAGFLTDDGDATYCSPKTYKLTGVNVVAGSWYRLTVRAIADFTTSGAAEEGGWDAFLGFTVSLDGTLLSATEPTVDESYIAAGIDGSNGFLSDETKSFLESKTVFPCLIGMESVFQLSAIGFKGSGAIDDFLVTTTAPSYETSITLVDFTLTWDEGVSSVTYTIGDGAPITIEEPTTDIKVASGTLVSVDVVADPWYAISGYPKTIAVNGNTTERIVSTAKTMDQMSNNVFPSTVSTSDVKKWMDAKNQMGESIKVDDLSKPLAYNSFLLNTSLLTAEPKLTIDDVTVENDQMTITVSAKKGETDGGGVINLEDIYGALFVQMGDTLDNMAKVEPVMKVGVDNIDQDEKLTVTLDTGKKFVRASIQGKTSSGAE